MMSRKPVIRCAAAVLVATLAWGIMVVTTGPARANPLPPGGILIHVQPVNPDFCVTNPIADCAQIVSHTDADGVLEFDLFLLTFEFDRPVGIQSLLTMVQWPGQWTLLDYEICHGGEGPVEIIGNQAIMDITWPTCPVWSDEVFLAARFIIDVQGYGSFGQFEGFENTLVAGCPDSPANAYLMVGRADAGVECTYCYTQCNLGSPCNPHPDPDVLELQVPVGQTVQRDIHVPIFGGDLVYPCPTTFVADESWMSLDYEEIGWNDYMVTLTVDTSELQEGFYDGWVRAMDQCVGCTWVNLEVMPPTAVGDYDLPDGPEPVASTWGLVKVLYR